MPSNNIPDAIALLEGAQEKELYHPLTQQLRKDFSRANVDLVMDKGQSPVNLVALVHENLYRLLMERFSEYLNLVYIIDVPEKAFKDISLTDVVEVAEHMTFLVIKREFEKVVLRKENSD